MKNTRSKASAEPAAIRKRGPQYTNTSTTVGNKENRHGVNKNDAMTKASFISNSGALDGLAAIASQRQDYDHPFSTENNPNNEVEICKTDFGAKNPNTNHIPDMTVVHHSASKEHVSTSQEPEHHGSDNEEETEQDSTAIYLQDDNQGNNRDCFLYNGEVLLPDDNLAKDYMKHCEMIGLSDSSDGRSEKARRITRQYGWKDFKLLNESDFHHTSAFAECLIDHFGWACFEEEVIAYKWSQVKKDVYHAMQVARSSATQALKKSFLEQYINRSLPTMDMFRMMRTNSSCYSLFVEKFVSCVIGTNVFKTSKLYKPLQSFCTVSDEAMTFLILENNWDVWSEIGASEIRTERKPIKSCNTKQKFFDPKVGRGYSWTTSGKDYYNKMFDLIKTDRLMYGKHFDEQLLASFTTMNDEGLRNKREKRRKLAAGEKTVIVCKSDYVPKAARMNVSVNYQFTQPQLENIVNQVTNPTNI